MIESPLSEVIRDRRINGVLNSVREAVRAGQPFTIAPEEVDYVRRNFHQALQAGEKKLYELAHTLFSDWAPQIPIEIKLVVLGRCPQGGHEAILENQTNLSKNHEELFSMSDSLLAARYVGSCGLCGSKATVIASYVRYSPASSSDSLLLFLLTRIKTTSNICFKIADLVFEIDYMFKRDKVLNAYGLTLSDVYGMKAVVRGTEDIPRVLQFIRAMSRAEVLEENDYTGKNKKKSGFEAYKMVVKRDRHVVELQIQSKGMYDFELTSHSANHRTYKERLMEDRRKLGAEYIQLFQALSRLFQLPEQNYCDIAYIELGYSKKGMDDEI